MNLRSLFTVGKLRSRLATHVLLTVSVVVLLVAGLLVPFAFGERVDVVASGSDDAAASASAGELSTVTTVASEATADAPAAPEAALPVATSGAAKSGGAAAAGTTGPSTVSGGGTQAPEGTQLTASDRGVTPTSIKLGIMILNVANAAAFGVNIPGASPAEQRVAWKAWLDELNESGGILGRKVEPFYKEYDVLSEQSMQAACLAATQDQKVFTVIDAGGLSYTSGLCVTRDNQTPFYTLGNNGTPKGGFQEARGLWFQAFEGGVRAIANMVGELEASGRLADRKIGLLTTDRPGAAATIEEGAVKVLAGYGRSVTHRVDLSSDIQTASSQVPLAVQQMQEKGVDTILFLTSGLNATQFVNNADGRQYKPKYYVSDYEGGYSDTWVDRMPASFEGSSLFTSNRTGEFRQNRPEPAPDKRCREIYERRSGTKLDRSTINYNFSVRGCMLLDMVVASATKVGPDLTRPKLVAATQQLGPVPLPTFGGGSFGPGKYDAADLFREAKYQASCGEGGGAGRGCWMPFSEFRQGQF